MTLQRMALLGAASQLWTPSQITTALWIDASDINTVTQSSGLVSQINDKSGNGRNFTATGSSRPTYTADAINGLYALSFNGSQWLTSASATSVWTSIHSFTGASVFVLWKPGITSDPNNIYGCIGNNAATSASVGFALWYDDRASINRNNRIASFITDNSANWVINTTTADNFATPNQYQVCGWILNPNAAPSNRSSVRVNGGAASQTNTDSVVPTSSSPTYALQIGATGNNIFPLVGSIVELVIVPGTISDANRQRMEGYMAWRGGFPLSLPSDHPYRSAAPTIS